MSVGCPRCGGSIRCTSAVTDQGCTITLNRLDVLRHATSCYGGPPDGGEFAPLPRAA